MGRIGLRMLGFFLLLAAILGLLHRPSYVYLMAHEIVPVYATEFDAMKMPAPEPIWKMAPQEKLPVVKCIEVKSNVIYKVKLPNSTQGFINAGEYDLGGVGRPGMCS